MIILALDFVKPNLSYYAIKSNHDDIHLMQVAGLIAGENKRWLLGLVFDADDNIYAIESSTLGQRCVCDLNGKLSINIG